jgi:hypothetical protein
MRHSIATLLLVGLLVPGSAPCHGQDGRRVGLTLGVNRVTLTSPNASLAGNTVFSGGLVVQYPLSRPVSLQAELLLNQKGTAVENEQGGAINYGAGYLDVPLLLHLEAPSVQSVTVYGEGGGFGGIKLFERQTPGDNISIPFETGTSFFQRFDAGVLAGLGAMIPIGGQRLNLVVRRAWGLMDVARQVETQPFSEAPFPGEGQTRTWSLLLRLGF